MSTFTQMAEDWLRLHLSLGSPTPDSATIAPAIPDADPAPWRGDFGRWMAERSIHREGREDIGSIGCLLLDFTEWAIHNSVPCDRRTFEALLTDAGFPVVDGMACGLLLRVDLEAALSSLGASTKTTRNGESPRFLHREGRVRDRRAGKQISQPWRSGEPRQ